MTPLKLQEVWNRICLIEQLIIEIQEENKTFYNLKIIRGEINFIKDMLLPNIPFPIQDK